MRNKRPAETAGGLFGAVTVIAAALGASVEVVAAVGAVAGLLPALVTSLVNHGGLRGLARSIWQGRTGHSLIELLGALFLALLCVLVLFAVLDRA